MKFILIIILSISLQACGMFKKNPEVVVVTPKIVHIDKDVIIPCSMLDEEVTISTFEDALVAYSNLGMLYGVCANKQNTSIKIIKQFGNIK